MDFKTHFLGRYVRNSQNFDWSIVGLKNDDVSKGAIYAGVLAVVLRDLRDEAPTMEAMLAVISIALASSAFDNEETEQFFCWQFEERGAYFLVRPQES